MRAIATVVLVLAFAAAKATATAQYPDKIIYEGKEYALLTNPMEPYFKKHPDKRPRPSSTALWRGYVATFEFKDKALMLKDIEIQDEPEGWKSIRNDLFGRDQIPIDWFSGILVLPDGQRTAYVHMGYGSSYARYILLEVRDGKLTGERKLDQQQYADFREKQFQAFKKTEEYKKIAADLAKSGDSQEFIDSFLRNFVVNYTSRFLDEEESPPRGKDQNNAGPTTRDVK